MVACIGMTTFDTLLFVPILPSGTNDIIVVTSGCLCLGDKGLITALAQLPVRRVRRGSKGAQTRIGATNC